MSDKLTCKMSDGTEWEVHYRHPLPTLEGCAVAHLKPIKREPRDFWISIDKKLDFSEPQIAWIVDRPENDPECGHCDRKFIKVREVIDEG